MTTTTPVLDPPVPRKPFKPAHPGSGDRPRYLPTGSGATDSRLRRLRLKAGLTQKRLAELTAQVDQVGAMSPQQKGKVVYGVSDYSINRFENGIHAPRPRYLRLIADALSEALGERITTDDLRVQGKAGLVAFLERTREARGVDKPTFYYALGIKNAKRIEALLDGDADWTAPELGRAAILFPESRPLTQDVLVEQARQADKRLPRAREGEGESV
jgi:transcriptional regulator with XRE-family HTH domain